MHVRAVDKLNKHSTLSWNLMISTCVRHGDSSDALQHFQQMQQESIIPDMFTFVHIVFACASQGLLAEGKRMHARAFKGQFESNIFMGTTLLSMYGKCGKIENAERVFHQMIEPDVVSWNAMIRAYAENGHGKEALELFEQMQPEGLTPDKATFICILGACANEAALVEGRQCHTRIMHRGIESDHVVATALVNMYGKCDSVGDAQRTFDSISACNVVSWNALIAAYARHGQGEKAFQLLNQMHHQGVIPVRATFLSLLSLFNSQAPFAEGKHMHVRITYGGLGSDVIVVTALLNMYSNCKSLQDAHGIFDKMAERSTVSWNAMIAACVQNGQGKEAFQLFDQMLWQGVTLDKVTFVSMLSASALEDTLTNGTYMHLFVIEYGSDSDVVVATALVSMYGKFGKLHSSRRSFDKISKRNIISWNAMIATYSHLAHAKQSLQVFHQMKQEGSIPDEATFASIFSAIANEADLSEGKRMHACLLANELKLDDVVRNSLINMYSKCGSLEDTWKIFGKLPHRDIFSWNAIIMACAQCAHSMNTLHLLNQMQQEGVMPDKVSFVSILDLCARSRDLAEGRRMHACITCTKLVQDHVIATALVNMYGKSGSQKEAQKVFDTIPERDTVLWNTIITMYVQHGQGKHALQLADQMQQEGRVPDNITFISIVSACVALATFAQGLQVHSRIRCTKLELDVNILNALIYMYGKCGRFHDAKMLFDKMPKRDAVSWSGMIALHIQHGFGKEALQLLHQMMLEGTVPHKATFVSALSACACQGVLAHGKQMHTHIVLLGFESDCVMSNALINMYGKCGSLEDTWIMFDRICKPDIVSWNAMLATLVRYGHDREALQLFAEMEEEMVSPDTVTFLSILSACASFAVLARGKHVHARIIHYTVDLDIVVFNSLVHMYGKCGSLEDALVLFRLLRERDVVSWNAMIAAYAEHGHGNEALELLNHMKGAGLILDEVTCLTILLACSHAGLVDDCCRLLVSVNHIKLDADHYDCLIDVLGRVGQLPEAVHLINNMPFQPTSVSWMTLLAACRDQADIVRGEQIARYIFEIDPGKVSTFTMLSNISAATSREHKFDCMQDVWQGKRSGFSTVTILGDRTIN